MSSHLSWELLAILAGTIGLSFILTAIARRLARLIGFVDLPDGIRKIQTEPIPLMGGVAVYAAFLLMLLVSFCCGPQRLVEGLEFYDSLQAILISGGLYCLLGLWDDKYSPRARYKLLLQIVATIPFVLWGHTIESVSFLGLNYDLGVFGGPLTIFWIVGCVNAVNLVDGLDGLASSIGAIASLTLAIFAVTSNMLGIAVPAIILCGALIGFLIHNWPPAKIYLGDSGSMTIGFLVGAFSLEASMKTAAGFTLVAPLVLLSVPIFDTFMAVVRRKLEGRGIGEPDRKHIHHRLQDSGLSKTQSLIAISGLCLAMSGAALLSVYLQDDMVAVGLCASIFIVLIVGRVFGYDETILFFRHIRAVSSLLVTTSKILQARLILSRMDHGVNEKLENLWDAISQHARDIGCSSMEALIWDEQTDKASTRLVWSEGEILETNRTQWKFICSASGSDGHRVTMIALGQTSTDQESYRGDDRFRLMELFCQRLLAVADEETGILGDVSSLSEQNTPPPGWIISMDQSEKQIEPIETLDDRRAA